MPKRQILKDTKTGKWYLFSDHYLIPEFTLVAETFEELRLWCMNQRGR